MLVADRRRSPVVGNGYDDDGQIEVVLGTVGEQDGAVNPVVADLRRLKPLDQQRSGDHDLEILANRVRGMAGIFEFQGKDGSSRHSGASSQQAFRGERDSLGKIAT